MTSHPAAPVKHVVHHHRRRKRKLPTGGTTVTAPKEAPLELEKPEDSQELIEE
jgi:hypothetical protein